MDLKLRADKSPIQVGEGKVWGKTVKKVKRVQPLSRVAMRKIAEDLGDRFNKVEWKTTMASLTAAGISESCLSELEELGCISTKDSQVYDLLGR